MEEGGRGQYPLRGGAIGAAWKEEEVVEQQITSWASIAKAAHANAGLTKQAEGVKKSYE